MKKINLPLILLFMTFFMSCSSLPKDRKPTNINYDNGINMYNKAVSLENENDYSSSLWYYDQALKNFELYDFQTEILRSLFGILKTSNYTKDTNLYEEILHTITNIYLPHNQNLMTEFTLTKAEIYIFNQQYTETISLLEGKSFKEINHQLKRLTILSLAKTLLDIDPEIATLSKMLKKVDRQFNKRKFHDAYNLAYSYYVEGLIHYQQGKLHLALKSFNRSKEIDKQYNNNYGLALNILQTGLIHNKLNNLNDAQSAFYRALQIFEAIKNKYYAEYTTAQLLIIQHKLDQQQYQIQLLINFSNQTSYHDIKKILVDYINE